MLSRGLFTVKIKPSMVKNVSALVNALLAFKRRLDLKYTAKTVALFNII